MAKQKRQPRFPAFSGKRDKGNLKDVRGNYFKNTGCSHHGNPYPLLQAHHKPGSGAFRTGGTPRTKESA